MKGDEFSNNSPLEKGEYKVRPRTVHESPNDYRYSCTPSFILVLDVLDD